jgi:hypothetical protein
MAKDNPQISIEQRFHRRKQTMRRFDRSTAGAAALAALMLLPAAGFAATGHHEARGDAVAERAAERVQLVRMGGGTAGGPGMMAPGQGYAPGPCQGSGSGYGMGPGMMGQGMMGPSQGYGYGMGPGMMGQGYGPGQGMGPGMMGPGQGYAPGYGMGPGMMAPGAGPQPGYGMGPAPNPDADLSADDVRARIERNLAWHGNPRLKVGDVTETDEDTITADIVTKDGSLVQRFMVDRHNGWMRSTE